MAKTQTTEANAAAFTKAQLVASQRYVHRRDLIGALLEDGKTYTLNEVDADAAHGVNAGDNVAWNGTTWDVLAGTMDLSAYMLAEDLVAISNTELDNICK